MRIVNKKLAMTAAVVCTAGVAYADDDDDSVACPPPPAAQQPPPAAQPAPPAPQPTYETTAPEVEEHPGAHLLAGVGAAISAGGGVDDFAGDTMRNLTGIGGSWNVRFVLGTRSYIAGEVSYIGSSQSIHNTGNFHDTSLVGNGAQAGLRLNATDSYPIQPFLYGAAAWRHYSFTNNLNTGDDHDDVFEVPVGVGVAAYVEGIALDVRGEYRFAWGSDSMPVVGNANVDRWGVTGNIGLEF